MMNMKMFALKTTTTKKKTKEYMKATEPIETYFCVKK